MKFETIFFSKAKSRCWRKQPVQRRNSTRVINGVRMGGQSLTSNQSLIAMTFHSSQLSKIRPIKVFYPSNIIGLKLISVFLKSYHLDFKKKLYCCGREKCIKLYIGSAKTQTKILNSHTMRADNVISNVSIYLLN